MTIARIDTRNATWSATLKLERTLGAETVKKLEHGIVQALLEMMVTAAQFEQAQRDRLAYANNRIAELEAKLVNLREANLHNAIGAGQINRREHPIEVESK